MLGRRCSSRQGHHHFQSEQRGVDHFFPLLFVLFFVFVVFAFYFFCLFIFLPFVVFISSMASSYRNYSRWKTPISRPNESRSNQVRILVVNCHQRRFTQAHRWQFVINKATDGEGRWAGHYETFSFNLLLSHVVNQSIRQNSVTQRRYERDLRDSRQIRWYIVEGLYDTSLCPWRWLNANKLFLLPDDEEEVRWCEGRYEYYGC